MIAIALSVASAIFALAAAILWFVSAAGVKTPGIIAILARYDYTESPDLQVLAKQLCVQSRWSARAAICACVAAFLQALAIFPWS